MISDTTLLKELEAEILRDADYFCSTEFQRNIGSDSAWDKVHKFEMILFLLQVFSISKKREYLSMTNFLMEQAYEEYLSSTHNMSFINGGAGILYLYGKLNDITGNEKYIQKSLEIINNCSDYFLESDQVDESLYTGRAGLLLNILCLMHKSGNYVLFKHINQLSRKIISNAVQIQGGLAWYHPFELVIQPLCSFGHGASGIGYVFQALGNYTDHQPFKEIAKSAFTYVNQQCLNKDLNLWNDYRKYIANEVDLSLHRKKFLDGDTSFFNTPCINHSISHGTAGIVYSQIGDRSATNKIRKISEEHLQTKEDYIGLANLSLELFAQKGLQQSFEHARALFSKLNYHEEGSDYLSLATLKLSLLMGKPCSFQMPKFNYNNAIGTAASSSMLLSDSDIFNLLTAKSYDRTVEVLKAKNHLDSKSDVKNAWKHPEAFLGKKIKMMEAGSQILKFIEEVFQYEKELNDLKLKQRFNPYFHMKQAIALDNKINSLQIPEHELDTKNLKISETAIIRQTYTEVSKRRTDSVPMFWKYDLEKGAVEVNLNPIKFLLDLFKEPKCIKVALQEMLYYCELMDDIAILPLIEYSNSKNRKDLIRRLPFVFRYQVKILIADGILKWA